MIHTGEAMSTQFERRLNNIDFLRLALALTVVFSHCFLLIYGGNDAEPLMRLTHGQATFGDVAVDAFFILSGFLITASYQRSSSALSFLKKRAARIYPAFAAITLMTAFCFIPLGGGQLEGQTLFGKTTLLLANLVRLRDIRSVGAFAHNPLPYIVNTALWTVSYEFFCYLGVLALGLTGAIRRRGLIVAALCVSIVVSVLYAHFGWQGSKSLLTVLFGYPEKWARLIPMYLVGVAFCLYQDSIRLRRWGAILSLIAISIACVIPCGFALLFPVSGAYLLMHFAFWQRLSLHRLTRFGDLSYGTYLFAMPIQQLIIEYLGLRQSPWKLFLIATPIVLAVATVSWFWIEKPALSFGKRSSRSAAAHGYQVRSSMPIAATET